RQLVDRLEAVEAHAHVFEVQDAAVRDVDLARDRMAREPRRPPTGLGAALEHLDAVALEAFVPGIEEVGRHFARPFFTWCTRPTTPFGRNSVTPMKSAPRKYSQNSGAVTVSQLFMPLTRKAPTMGPMSVARPPT